MGRALYDGYPSARAVFEEADSALGFPLSRILFDGPAETLQQTEHTQPALLTVSVAAWRVLAEAVPGLTPSFAAGHSLGEYSAHVVAGTLSFADAVRTVRLRGQFMQEAVPAGEGSMAALLGLAAEQVNDLCAQAADELSAPTHSEVTPTESERVRAQVARAIVSPANLNSPEQIVISGSTAAVDRAIELCRAAGAKKVVPLQVSAPFHCALMEPAQQRLATTLEALTLNDPDFPVACTVDARLLTRHTDVLDALIRQVTGPVRWVECLELLVAQGATHLIELGPGKVLTGLSRQILGRGVVSPVSLNVEDQASLEKTIAALNDYQGAQA